MTRRSKTIAILGLEACLLLAMAASLVYFARASRDFTLARPAADMSSKP